MGELGSLVDDVLRYLQVLARVTWLALQLNRQLIEIVAREPNALAVTAGVAIVAGASTLLGQSVMLFVNRVRPGRFLASVLLNGVLYTLGLLVWGAMIWLVGNQMTDRAVPLGAALRVVCLSAAPLVFGVLVLIPYAGLAIDRALRVWSLLITIGLVEYGFGLGLMPALVCTGLGWLLVMGLTYTVGRPVVALRNRLWRRVAGTTLDASAQDLLVRFGTGDDEPSPPGRRR